MRTINFIQLLKDYNVVIPPIQRDYAQGRQNGKIPYIRNRFLNAIFEVLSGKKGAPLNLDFIYGYVVDEKRDNKDIKNFKPLDGQQRLTTVFLLHWYVLHKEIKDPVKLKSIKNLLNNFSYTTRNSSKDFCDKLVDFNPNFKHNSLQSEIIDQPWFYATWKSDPTISSMLVMFDAIEDKYRQHIVLNSIKDNTKAQVWNKLVSDNSHIIFHLLPMDDLGLPDDLYIKMNSRGKELTDFEHFKSSFSEFLNNEHSKIFNNKIDQEWSDLFWNIFKNKYENDIAKYVDDGFLNFFWYITDILIRTKDIEIKEDFWLERARTVYGKYEENVKFLFDCISLFENFEKKDLDYFNGLFYIKAEDFSNKKTRLFFRNPHINLFHKCATNYQSGGFGIQEQVLFYAFIQIQLKDKQVPENFFRLLRNLLEHAADKEIRNEKLGNLYDATDKLIDGERNPKSLPFTKRQLEEEKAKKELISKNKDLKDIICKLDDHSMLRGSIAVLDIDERILDFGEVFVSVFNTQNNLYETSRALLTFGDYSQMYGKHYKRYGNKNTSVWREIMTQSDSRKGFENTKSVLKSYLNEFIVNPNTTNESLVNSFLKEHTNNPEKPKDLRYYMIRYNSFILWEGNATQGYYYFNDHDRPYECIMMFRTQFNGRHWNPFLLEINDINSNCSLEKYGNDMQFIKDDIILMIKNVNNGFMLYAPENEKYSSNFLNNLINDSILDTEGILLVNQDENGIDLEDRIQKLNSFLNGLNTHYRVNVDA